jgi:hypothetical protein
MKENKGDAYHLFCEALDWNPESSEALAMLQKLRPSSRRPRTAFAGAIAFGLAALLIAIFSFPHARASLSPPIHQAVYSGEKEYLEPMPRHGPTAVSAAAPLRTGHDVTRLRALIDVRDVPPDAILYLDDSLMRGMGSRARLDVTAGGHVLHAKNSSGTLWRQRVEVAPFETLRLQVER